MKDKVCDWVFNLSSYPEKLHSTENLVDITKFSSYTCKKSAWLCGNRPCMEKGYVT